MTTRRTNQVDLDLSSIDDSATRQALASVMRFVNDLASGGLTTDGTITGKTLATKGGSLTEEGVLTAKLLDMGEGRITFTVQTGSLAAITATVFTVKGQVLGALGWSEVNGGASGVDWVPMTIELNGNSNYFTTSTSENSNKVRIKNNGGSSNKYRLLIFYAEY